MKIYKLLSIGEGDFFSTLQDELVGQLFSRSYIESSWSDEYTSIDVSTLVNVIEDLPDNYCFKEATWEDQETGEILSEDEVTILLSPNGKMSPFPRQIGIHKFDKDEFRRKYIY